MRQVATEKVITYGGDEQEFVRQFAEWLQTFRTDAFHIFIFSLSAERNLLSQWRSYARMAKA